MTTEEIKEKLVGATIVGIDFLDDDDPADEFFPGTLILSNGVGLNPHMREDVGAVVWLVKDLPDEVLRRHNLPVEELPDVDEV